MDRQWSVMHQFPENAFRHAFNEDKFVASFCIGRNTKRGQHIGLQFTQKNIQAQKQVLRFLDLTLLLFKLLKGDHQYRI